MTVTVFPKNIERNQYGDLSDVPIEQYQQIYKNIAVRADIFLRYIQGSLDWFCSCFLRLKGRVAWKLDIGENVGQANNLDLREKALEGLS